MGLHTRKQLAELIGLDYSDKNDRAKITMWIKRGNVIIDENDLIDDTVSQNKYWIEKQSKLKKSNEVEKNPEVILQEPKENTKKENKKSDKKLDWQQKLDLEIEKKALEIEKLKVDTRLQELKEEKIRGEVIPIAIVKTIVSTLSQAILTSQKDSIEAILINISKEARLSGDQLAGLRGKMVKDLNAGVDKAISIALRNLKALVEEFSIKKEVGEHE